MINMEKQDKKKPVASDMHLPLTIEDITASWLTQALSFRYAGIKITSLEVEEVQSMTSSKIWVRPSYGGRDYGLPATMIVKGGFGPHSSRLGFMHASEVMFYRNIRD